MEISLKKARALLKKIDGGISSLQAKAVKSNKIRINYYTHSGYQGKALETKIDEDINNMKKSCVKSSVSLYQLLALKYRLRSDIGKLNEEKGINEALNKKNHDLAKKSILSSHVNELRIALEEAPSFVEIKNTLEVGPVKESAYSSKVKECVVPVLGEQDLDIMRVNIAKLDKRIEEIEDEIMRINLSSVVGLTDDDLALLAEVNIHL